MPILQCMIATWQVLDAEFQCDACDARPRKQGCWAPFL